MFGTVLSGFEIALTAIIIYFVIYALLNRICNCLELRAMYTAISIMDAETFQKFIEKMDAMK